MSLIEFCSTERQREVIELAEAGESFHSIGRKLGLTFQYVSRIHKLIKERAATYGHAPESGFNHKVPAPHIAKGVSNLWKRGEPSRWRGVVICSPGTSVTLRQSRRTWLAR